MRPQQQRTEPKDRAHVIDAMPLSLDICEGDCYPKSAAACGCASQRR